MSGKTECSAAHCKQHIVKSLNEERWGFADRFVNGVFGSRHIHALAHPRAGMEVMVTRGGSVFLHGIRVLFRNSCVRKAARRQLLTHLHCDLSGRPENNR